MNGVIDDAFGLDGMVRDLGRGMAGYGVPFLSVLKHNGVRRPLLWGTIPGGCVVVQAEAMERRKGRGVSCI